jgi:ribose transport system substrate-binding protein
MAASSNRSRYLVQSVMHASRVLDAFQHSGEVLRLRDVVARTGFDKGTAFRLLYTLHECGLVEKVAANQYRCPIRLARHKRFRIGYAGDGVNSLFSREVMDGLKRAAEKEDLELLMEDNRYRPKVALRVAEHLINEGVDLIIEYQADYQMAPIIASMCVAANIPLIALEIPHPGATFFGANNYEAGLIGGRHLGRWAERHWGGACEEIILVEQRRAGPLPQARLRGTQNGIAEVLPAARQCRVTYLDGDSDLGRSQGVVRQRLRFTAARHILVGGLDDICALGALRAFEEAGRAECCAVMGQNGAPEAREELRRPGTRLIGSVGYFPETYGEGLVKLALDILGKKQVPPAVFVKHRLITAENVNHLYSNDALLQMSAGG